MQRMEVQLYYKKDLYIMAMVKGLVGDFCTTSNLAGAILPLHLYACRNANSLPQSSSRLR